MSENFRCAVATDGSLWSPSVANGYSFYEKYLSIFDDLRVVARAMRVDEPPEGWCKVSGPGVRAVSVPSFIGPWQLAPKYFGIRSIIERALRECEAILLRLPSTMGQLIWTGIDKSRPYGITVTGNPYEALAPGMVSDLSRPLFRQLYSRRLRRQCARACAVSYVTAEALQRHYPPPPEAFCTSFTDATLDDAARISAPRVGPMGADQYRVVTVGSLAHLIKGTGVLIDAIQICLNTGMNITAVIIGDGIYRGQMESRCRALGIDDKITFAGQLSSGHDIRAQLDRSDVFVLPSMTEGLPRAMLEAMARGLPCIGTAVGGIPELLSREDLVAPGDACGLARKIQEVLTNPERLARMSARNLEKCNSYSADSVRTLRTDFLLALRRKTEEWLWRRSQANHRH